VSGLGKSGHSRRQNDFCITSPVSLADIVPLSDDPRAIPCLHCDIANLLELPDPDFEDLIEQSFWKGQIDGEESDLAYFLLASASRIAGTFVGTDAN